MAKRRPRISSTATMLCLPALVFGVLAGCSNESKEAAATDLRLDQIEAALDAVMDVATPRTGQEIEFFEVNATDLLVSVFVATDLDGEPNADGLADGVMRYVYSLDDGVEVAPEVVAATGPTFSRSAISFDPNQILKKVTAELPDSSPQMFVMTGAGTAAEPTGTVEYRLVMESSQGGQLTVLLSSGGEIVGTDAS